MSLAQLLSHYGYLAVFIGCLLEGETILILAGFAAHQGYLSFPLVLVLAISGGTLGDQLFFFLGRHFGIRLIEHFPSWASRVQRIHALMQRYQAGLIMGVRFLYGLRIIGPIVMGSSRISSWQFVGFNLLGAALWAVLIASTGYFFGQTLQWLFADLKHYEEWAFALLGLLVLITGLGHGLRQKKHKI